MPIPSPVRVFASVCIAAAALLIGSAGHARPVPVFDVERDHAWDLFGFDSPAAVGTGIGTIEKPWKEAPFPYLPDEPFGRSVSIGTVTDGHIAAAVPLPMPGRTYGVLPRQLARGLTYGSEELIAGLVEASEYVADVHPGSVLWFGNIGRRGGGDIPWSVSHNAGRDADLAFYTLDPEGRPIAPPDLLHYRSDGRSREYGGYYRFDDARNWALVKALALSSSFQIQHLFISDGLRARLLRFARESGEPPRVIDRVAGMLRQPGPEIPHDDHLHLRIYCSEFDVAGGCDNIGRVQPGTELYASARSQRIADATHLLRDGDAETRRRAVERLRSLGAASRLDAIHRRLSDPSPMVRAAAIRAIAELGDEDNVNWLVLHWEEETDDFVRVEMVEAAGRLGGRSAGLFLTGLLQEPHPVDVDGRAYDLRIVATDAVRQSARAEPAWALVALLAEPDIELRARAAEALRVVANRSVDSLDWRQLPGEEAVALASGAWSEWLRTASSSTRDEWVVQGFEAEGVPMRGGARAAAEALARQVGDSRDWVSVNAQRELMRMTGNSPRSLDWPRSDAETYWVRWVRRNPGRVRW